MITKNRTKIVFLLFLFAATIKADNRTVRNSKDADFRNYGALYGNTSHSPDMEAAENSGALFRTSNVSDPGERPDAGDAIGMNAPIPDGLPVLVFCCASLIIWKIFAKKMEKKVK